MSGQVYYYVSKYNDEVPPHEPTLEAAAKFLHTGCGEDGDFYADQAPLAKPGDIIELSTLAIFFDTEARLVEDGAGGEVWTFAPAIPPDADFAAIRFCRDAGWTGDDIFNPHGTDRDIAEMMESQDTDGDTVEHIAIGRTGTARARYDLIDGTPVLTLLEDGEIVDG
jgi:hypothetical protein